MCIVSTPTSKSVVVKPLSATAGSLCGSEGEDFERAVKEEAERIDNDVS